MTLNINYDGLQKVISGGQTGADQGGLLAAWRVGIETGGIAPNKYKTQSGCNPLLEVLGLTDKGNYVSRTFENINNSDGTILIAHNLASPGTQLTLKNIRCANKPVCIINIADIVKEVILSNTMPPPNAMDKIKSFGSVAAEFIETNKIVILNVAGNREIHTNDNGFLLVTSISDWILSHAFKLLNSKDTLFKK